MYDLPYAPAALQPIIPLSLTWPEVDPARHAFDPAAVPAVVRSLPPAVDVPRRPGRVSDPGVTEWGRDVGAPWANAMSRAVVGRYGRWACGWRWALGEGDFDGGPVTAWCCPVHTMSDPEATLAALAAGLVEWRLWLEDLDERFARFLPIPAGATEDVVLDVWERAVAHLVTVVAVRTDAQSAWYNHCKQVLGWFLSAAGIPPEQHGTLLDGAIGGRFRSWSEPEQPVVDEVAGRLAGTMVRRTGA